MFENDVPMHKLGVLSPLSVIDNAAYEFYRLAPSRTMLVMIPIGLSEFSSKDVERVFAPLDSYLDQLMAREVHLVMQSGTPLPILIGVEAHDRMIKHMAEYTGLPATSTVLAVCRVSRALGIRTMALVNKWTESMNACLGEFLAREGVSICGAVTKELAPAEFVRIKDSEHMTLAYELGRRAFLDNPDCDGIYVGGGSWLSAPVCERLEGEFGKPAICNQTAIIWDTLHVLGAWQPVQGRGRVLSTE